MPQGEGRRLGDDVFGTGQGRVLGHDQIGVVSPKTRRIGLAGEDLDPGIVHRLDGAFIAEPGKLGAAAAKVPDGSRIVAGDIHLHRDAHMTTQGVQNRSPDGLHFLSRLGRNQREAQGLGRLRPGGAPHDKDEPSQEDAPEKNPVTDCHLPHPCQADQMSDVAVHNMACWSDPVLMFG